jgi:dTDP-4-dehydrorhamnose reductase
LRGPVWITGAGGLIGNYLLRAAEESGDGSEAIGLTRAQLDLSDFPAVQRLFHTQPPKGVIHCAALSRSADSQSNPELARKLNVEVTQFLASLAADIPFLFLSTDLVFDGRIGNYDESASTNPLSLYAETKVVAEQIVLKNPNHTVVRTSLNGGTSPLGNRGFNEEIRLAWQAGRTLRLFTDEFRSPIPAKVTARALWELLGRSGVFHLAGSERLSRWEIGRLLACRWPQLNPKFEAASLKEYPGAPRSPDTSLNSAKVQQHLSFRLPGLSEWLRDNPQETF